MYVSVNILYGQTAKLWETDTVFSYPESVVFDKSRDVYYVSNYGKGFVSQVSKQGEVIDLNWIDGLSAPTGICIASNNLYVVERFCVAVYNLKTKKLSNKYKIEPSSFINDISIANDKSIYVSDSQSNVIYRIKDGRVEKWLESDLIKSTNGILVDNDKIIAGVNTDGYLKSIDIKTQEIKNIAFIGEGEIDGIKKNGDNYLVSIYEGKLLCVSKNGEVKNLLDTRDKGIQCADFEYTPNDSVVIIPALINNKLYGYKLGL